MPTWSILLAYNKSLGVRQCCDKSCYHSYCGHRQGLPVRRCGLALLSLVLTLISLPQLQMLILVLLQTMVTITHNTGGMTSVFAIVFTSTNTRMNSLASRRKIVSSNKNHDNMNHHHRDHDPKNNLTVDATVSIYLCCYSLNPKP